MRQQEFGVVLEMDGFPQGVRLHQSHFRMTIAVPVGPLPCLHDAATLIRTLLDER